MPVKDSQVTKIIIIFIFLEKVIFANASADPTKRIKKHKYLFEVSIERLWKSLPRIDVDSRTIEAALQEIYNFASQRDVMCVRTLLNTCLFLVDELKQIVESPHHISSFLNMEASILSILQSYDPEVSHEESQKVGIELGEEILRYLEKL